MIQFDKLMQGAVACTSFVFTTCLPSPATIFLHLHNSPKIWKGRFFFKKIHGSLCPPPPLHLFCPHRPPLSLPSLLLNSSPCPVQEHN